MRMILFILALIPLLSFGQSIKYYTKKQEIKALILYFDSVSSILKDEIATLLKDEEKHKIELEELYQKKEKIELANTFLKKAKRKTTIGNIVSGVTVSAAVTVLIVQNVISNNSRNQNNYAPDFNELYLAGSIILVFTGQAINIPQKINAKQNIQKAIDLIAEVD